MKGRVKPTAGQGRGHDIAVCEPGRRESEALQRRTGGTVGQCGKWQNLKQIYGNWQLGKGKVQRTAELKAMADDSSVLCVISCIIVIDYV